MSEKKEKEVKGLKSMRRNTRDTEPSYSCDNCKCKRYSECGCKKNKSQE